MSIEAGTLLGRYEIRSSLGAGGMGEVYRAQDTKLNREVAIKVLPAAFSADAERLRRFEQEAQAAGALNHPNILSVYDVGTHDGAPYLVTELLEGESLRQHITRSPMELREVLDVASQVASALAAAHQAGIVHRDIKPDNIMLRRDGLVKVLDFGIAKLTDSQARSSNTDGATMTMGTEPGVVMGTPSYMSPEQARGLKVDARSDIWSLGVVLYEMVGGRLPFAGATMSDVIATILHREPPSLLLYRSDMPVELERIVEKALTKGPDERYQTAKDVSLDLKRLKQRLEVDAELERSITPEEGARRASERFSLTSSQAAISGMTLAAAAPTAETSAAPTLSSAEYVIGKVKRHKRGAALVLAALVIAAVVAAFGYFKYFGSRSRAITSIAVLPFTNVNADPSTEYLSDGISESLIDTLSQLPGLKVIARGSSFKYKGKEVDPQEVATALGVQAILSGRVVQRGDQLQVRAELIDARDKTQLWGEQYNRKAADVQAVQEEIARTISEKLRLRLSGAQEQQLAKRATVNAQAYQLYLNGSFYSRKGGFENGRKALEYHNQAVALDPNFALAWTGVAEAYRYLQANGLLDPKETLPKAKAAAQKALELDETLAEAHVALGQIKSDEWDWPGAEREFKRAIELNPNLAEAHFSYSVYSTNVRRPTVALTEIKRAQELDPLRIRLRSEEGAALYFARRYDEAIQQLQSVIKLEPDDGFAHVYLGYIYALKGMYPQAIAEYQKQMSIDGETTSTQCYLGYALAQSGKRNEAQAILDKLKRTKEYVSPAELAILYVGLGDKEGAISSLEKAYAAHDLQMQYLKIEPHYDSMRSDPRFIELMRKVGLP